MSATIEGQLRQAIVTIRGLRQQVETLRSERRPAIAVVGIGCRLPGNTRGPDALWNMLMAGRDAIVEVPADRWDAAAWYDPDPEATGKMNSRWGGFLEGIDGFDPAFFELSSREASAMDPQQRLLLEVAWEALEDAAIAPDALMGSATGVFIGINGSDYYQMAMATPGAIDAHAISGGVASVAAGRLSYLLGLHGPALAIDTACSSSLAAIHVAVNSLRSGESRVALAGGVYAVLQPNLSVGLSKLRMMAPDGRCKTFDASADGFVQGEGCALVVLKRLDDAIADHDRVLAVIRGSAMNQDGRSSSLTAPSRGAQAAVIRAALQDAAIPSARIGYVEAHGTGTALGDPIEVHALGDAFGRECREPVVLGALKSNIGHLGPAAGVAGLVKAVLAVRHGVVPPNLHLARLNPDIAAETLPLRFPDAPTAWPLDGPRAAGVSSFGFSGTNVHVVLEEAPAPAADTGPLPGGWAVICASARTEAALQASIGALVAALGDGADLPAVSRASTFGRRAFEHRVAVVARDARSARELLAAAAPQRIAARPRLALRFADPRTVGDARQRAQALAGVFPVVRASLERMPAHAHPAAACVALHGALVEQLREWNIVPAICSGSGLGALTAAAAAGLLPWAALVQALDRDAPDLSSLAATLSTRAASPSILLCERTGRALQALSAADLEALWRDGETSVDVDAALRSLGATMVMDTSAFDGDPVPAWLNAVAAMHAHGVSPDWRKVLGDGPRASLPLYPFQRTRHWRETPPSTTRASVTALASWPPGERVPSPSSDAQFRMALGVEALPWLGDHRVHGLAVVPGAFQIACLAGAWRALQGDARCAIESLTFARPLIAPETGSIELWTVLSPTGDAKLVTRVEGRWIEHARARLATLEPAAPTAQSPQPHCPQAISPGQWREELAALGIAIGPSFQGLRKLARGDREALGDVALPACCRTPGDEWHPALLDACLQVAGGSLAESTRRGEALLPIGIDRVEIAGAIEGALNVHARCTAEGEVLSTDVDIRAATGNIVARIVGMHVRRAPLARVQAGDGRNLFHAVEWMDAPLVAVARAKGTRIVIAEDSPAVRELVARLAGAIHVTHLAPLEAALADAAQAEVIDLRPWNATGDRGALDACKAALDLLAVLARNPKPPRLTLVTRGAVMESRQPMQATLWGLAATAALEHPVLQCRCIDADSLADLAAELEAQPDGEAMIAWREGVRRVARLVQRRPTNTLAPTLRDTVLVTGGLGGVGREVARWCVARGASHLVLAGRGAANAEAQRFAQSLGVPTLLLRADVSRHEDVARLLREMQALPPLRGIFHAAGVQSEGLLASLPWPRFEAALEGKLAGAWRLHEASDGLHLDYFVLFSSIAATLGAAGQGGYAAANAGLDALARHRRARGLPALSIAWGRWKAPGMVDALDDAARRRIDALGIEPMEPAVALAAMDHALAADLVDPMIAAIDWDAYRAKHPGARPPRLLERLGREPEAEIATLPADFARLPSDARLETLTAVLAKRVAAALQSPAGEILDPERALVQLGLDSLMAMELRNRMQRDLGVAASIAELLGGASLRDIARGLERALPRGEALAAAAPQWEEFRL